jgi:hypothetical protein
MKRASPVQEEEGESVKEEEMELSEEPKKQRKFTGDRYYQKLEILQRCTRTGTDHTCVVCGKHLAMPQACSSCKLTFYCSEECQRKHWNSVHETECELISIFSYLNVGIQRSDYYRVNVPSAGTSNPRIHQLSSSEKHYVVTQFRGKSDPEQRKLWFDGINLFWVEPVKAGKYNNTRFYFIIGRDLYFISKYKEPYNTVMVAYAIFIANAGNEVSKEVYQAFGTHRPSQYVYTQHPSTLVFPTVPKKK